MRQHTSVTANNEEKERKRKTEKQWNAIERGKTEGIMQREREYGTKVGKMETERGKKKERGR